MSKPLNADQLFNAALKIYETSAGDYTLAECVDIAVDLRKFVDDKLAQPAAVVPAPAGEVVGEIHAIQS